MEIDHLTIPVASYEVSKRFYSDALAPLGLVVLLDWPDRRRAYFGVKGEPSCLWIVESSGAGNLEVTLGAESPDGVDAFHAAALSASAESVQEPGSRGEYNREYYAARVFDPDRNAIEVVCRHVARAAQAA